MLFYVRICMANSHGRLIHVDTCDRSEYPSEMQALALSLMAVFRPCDALLALQSRSAGQRRVCPLLGVCPRSLAVLILSPVASSLIWPCDLHHFPLTHRDSSPRPSRLSARLSSTSYFGDVSYPFHSVKYLLTSVIILNL